jgi:hypothetical protein
MLNASDLVHIVNVEGRFKHAAMMSVLAHCFWRVSDTRVSTGAGVGHLGMRAWVRLV